MTVKWEDIEPGAMLRYDFGDSMRHVVAVADGRCWVTYAASGGGVMDVVLRREFIEESYTLVKPFFEVGRLYGYHDRLFRVRDVVTLLDGRSWAWGVFLNDDDEVVDTGVYTEASFVHFTLVEE